MATFTDIVKEQRSQGAGVFSSLGKAAGQRTLERIDPRNYLFNRNGLATALFSGLKGYQSGSKKQTSSLGDSSSSLSSGQIDSLAVKIEIVAKNTSVLPLMARDMNVMRQNIIKLVKLNGGKPSDRASNFFMSAKEKENAYESKFGKKSPSQVGKNDGDKKSGSLLSNLIDFLFSSKGLLSLGILAGLGKLLENEEFRKTMYGWISGFFKAIFNGIAVTADFLGKILTDPAVVESIKNMFSHLFDLAKTIAFLPVADIAGFQVNLLEAVLGSMAVWFGTKGAMTAIGSILMKSIGVDAIGVAAGGLISKAILAVLAPEVLLGLLIAAVTGGVIKYLQDPKYKEMIDDKTANNLNKNENISSKEYFDAKEELNSNSKDQQILLKGGFVGSKKKEAKRKIDAFESNTKKQQENNLKRNNGSPTPAGSSGDAKSQAEKYLGTGINDNDWEMLKHAVYAESSNNKEEYANVMAVILNRARNSGKSIRDVLFEPNQFQSVTGPGSTENFKKGPTPNISKTIDESATLLSGISQNLDSFTSANPNAYKDVGGQEKYNAKMEEMDSYNAKQIGQTKFAENMYSGKGKSSSLASAASAMPNINDLGKFLNEGSTEFENMIRDFMKSSGDTFINSDSSKKVVSSGSNQVPPVGSVWDKQIIPSLLGAPQMT